MHRVGADKNRGSVSVARLRFLRLAALDRDGAGVMWDSRGHKGFICGLGECFIKKGTLGTSQAA